MIERIVTVSLDDEKSRQYIHNQLFGVHQKGKQLLKKELGLDGVREFRKPFMLNDIFTEHGHIFIWSAELMVKVLRALGYRQAQVCEVGGGGAIRIIVFKRDAVEYIEETIGEKITCLDTFTMRKAGSFRRSSDRTP